MDEQSLPLNGVRIIAFSQFGAGPFATLNLADLGAEVIKIEDPATGGEVSRFVPPYRIDGDSLYFQSWNRNKRSIALDLRKPESGAVLRDLVRISDIVFNNLRGDQPSKLGIDYASLAATNPRIVCCSLNAFGSEGPRAREPGYDYLMQALTGYMSITGDPCGFPASCGISVIDHAAGFAAAMAMLSALRAVDKTGFGRDIEVSLEDTAYSMLTYLAIWNLNGGFIPIRHRGSAHQTLVPVQTFRTSDSFITIFCGKEQFWERLCDAFDDPELKGDRRFCTFTARFENRDEAIAAVQEHFLERTTTEWLEVLEGRVPCAPVLNIPDALARPELSERNTIINVEHPVFGTVREVNTPVRFKGQRSQHRRAPKLGEDTDLVLEKYAGYSGDRIAALRAAGVLG